MSEDPPESPQPRPRRQALLLVTVALMTLLGCGVVLASFVLGHGAGERQAETERLGAQQVELDWHDAHPDPTEPVLPDYSGYLGQLSEEVARS